MLYAIQFSSLPNLLCSVVHYFFVVLFFPILSYYILLNSILSYSIPFCPLFTLPLKNASAMIRYNQTYCIIKKVFFKIFFLVTIIVTFNWLLICYYCYKIMLVKPWFTLPYIILPYPVLPCLCCPVHSTPLHFTPLLPYPFLFNSNPFRPVRSCTYVFCSALFRPILLVIFSSILLYFIEIFDPCTISIIVH